MKTKLAAAALLAAEPWSVSSTCTVHQARCAGMKISPPLQENERFRPINDAGRNKSPGQTAATCKDDASAY